MTTRKTLDEFRVSASRHHIESTKARDLRAKSARHYAAHLVEQRLRDLETMIKGGIEDRLGADIIGAWQDERKAAQGHLIKLNGKAKL